MVDDRSPKRARTDSGPPNADSIAQSNSTLQIFLGQGNRQNRWMHGYVPPNTTNGTKNGTTNTGGGSVGSGVRTGSASHTALPNDGLTSDAIQTTQHARTSSMDHAQRHQVGDIVQYESPTTTTTLSTNAAAIFGKLAPTRTLSSSMASALPGLPSPAASDDNGVSPSLHAAQEPFRPPRDPPPQPGPTMLVRPASIGHSHHHPERTGSPSQLARPAPIQMRPKSRSSSASIIHSTIPAVLPSTAQPSIAAPRVPVVPSSSTVPSQPAVVSQSRQNMLSRDFMFHRFKTFQTTKGLNNVDNGRLTLLRDAIEQYDLCYIALSQIHALTKTPDLIPNSAQGLSPKSLQYLDYLICSTDQLSPEVLGWLSNFPAPILKIYSSGECAPIYEPVVQQVTQFLKLLPLHWDRVAMESKKREAPPLVEELLDVFELPSPVFHRTAFRAICRLILQPGEFLYPEKGIDRLEYLHTLDQMWFARFHRRSAIEKSSAHRAFLLTKLAWRDHESKVRAYERQQQLEGQPRPQPQQQSPLFMYPADSLAPFQLNRANNLIQPPGNPILPASINQQRALNQRQAMTSNAQAARNQPPPHRQSRASITQQFQDLSDRITGANRSTTQQVPPNRGYLFPAQGELPRAQATNPDPLRSALHQAHLRSPTLGPLLLQSQFQVNASSLYRYVCEYALSPQRLNKDSPVMVFKFDVPPKSLELITPTVPSETSGAPPSRTLTETSQLYRLRCAACPQSGFPEESAWTVAENYWPDELFLECNGTILEPRRKLQHGRHLPIDLTHLIKSQNTITATINRTSTDVRPFDYVIAVEIVGVKSHESIKNRIPTISRETTVNAIQKSLASSNDSDELAVTSSNLTIRLFDPYSNSKIFDTPVRGSACAHKDCFDLETFLSMCKREKPGWPSVVDCWRCPLCRGDVRPHTLVTDGFLAEVRSELEKRGLLNTRAIVVEVDGTWKPKAEEMTGVRSPSFDREERSGPEKTRNATASASKKVMEVIKID